MTEQSLQLIKDPRVWIGGVSLIFSACALILSWRSDSRSQIAARAQLFMSLRTRFLKVLEDLPPEYSDPKWDASDPLHREAANRYWHNAFDEWYVTTRLHAGLMRPLWDQFYSKAILAGLGHNGLRKTLIEMRKQDRALAGLWKEFRGVLDRLWATDHPRNGTTCQGVDCNHDPA